MEELWTDRQKEGLQYFQDNLDRFLEDPLLKGKHLVIHRDKIAGAYDTFSTALTFAVQHISPGEFVIQEALSDADTVGFLYPAAA